MGPWDAPLRFGQTSGKVAAGLGSLKPLTIQGRLELIENHREMKLCLKWHNLS